MLSKSKGFTLLEVMVTMIITGIIISISSTGISLLKENQYYLIANNNLNTVYEYTSYTMKTEKYNKDIIKLTSLKNALTGLTVNNKKGVKLVDYTKEIIDTSTYIHIIYSGTDKFEAKIQTMIPDDNIYIIYKGRVASIYYGERNAESIKLYANVW